jgi:hypothetical protein
MSRIRRSVLLVTILMIAVGSAYAETLTVTLSGTFGSVNPTDVAGVTPGKDFTIKFEIDSNPTPTFVQSDDNAF